MEAAGVKAERFVLDWASAAEAPRFVGLITKFTRQMEEMGAMGHAEGKDAEELKTRLSAARLAMSGMKLRAGLGNLTMDFRKEGDYSLETVRQKVAEKLGRVIRTEISSQEILVRLQRFGPFRSEDLASKVGLSAGEVADFLSKMAKKGQVSERQGYWSLPQEYVP